MGEAAADAERREANQAFIRDLFTRYHEIVKRDLDELRPYYTDDTVLDLPQLGTHLEGIEATLKMAAMIGRTFSAWRQVNFNFHVNGPIVCVPYSNDINDFNMFARGGLSTRDGVDMLRLCFDQLHVEGAATGRIMNVGLHPHVIGQPHRIAALREFIEYAKAQPNVWFPAREEIATWFMATG